MDPALLPSVGRTTGPPSTTGPELSLNLPFEFCARNRQSKKDCAGSLVAHPVLSQNREFHCASYSEGCAGLTVSTRPLI